MQRPSLRNFLKTIRGRLVLLVLLVQIPALAVQVAGAWSDLRGDIEARKGESMRAVSHATGDFEALLAETRATFTDLVRTNEMRSPDNCTQVFTVLRLAYERLAPNAANLGLTDAEGNIYCSVNPVQDERNLAGRPEFQAAVRTVDMAVGSYTTNALSGSPQISIAYPVLSFDGRINTVIVATLNAAWLENWQRESALPTGSAVTLLGTGGRVLWRSLDGAPAPLQSLGADGPARLAAMQAGGTAVEGPDLDGVRRLHTVAPLQLDGQAAGFLHLGYPVAQLYSQAYRDLWWGLALVGGVLLLVLALAWQGSERLFLHPLRDLMAAVQRVQDGDLGARVSAVRGLGEVTDLAHAFDRMADTLQQREAERWQSEARFRAMYDNATVGVAIMALDRRVMDANQAAARMTGYPLEELVDSDAARLAYPDDAAIGAEEYRDMAAGKIPGAQMEKRFIRKDGSVFWGRVTYSVVPGSDGKPGYLVGLLEDVTDEKHTAERLAEQEARHRRMLEQRLAERSEELSLANERLREKAAQDAVTAERTRLARDLHDAVTQTLFSTTLIAEVLPDLWAMDRAEGERRLAELRQLTRGALAEMRTLLVELRPNALVEASLPTLLRQLTEAMTGRTRMVIEFSGEEVTASGTRRLPADVQVGLYRIAQEALNNVVKHAKATQAMVTLRGGEAVRLTVADNGAGFDPDAITADHLGLKIMRERAEAIGARLSIYSEPGEGTQVSVVWQG